MANNVKINKKNELSSRLKKQKKIPQKSQISHLKQSNENNLIPNDGFIFHLK